MIISDSALMLDAVWLRMERLQDFGSLQEMLGKFPKVSAWVDRMEGGLFFSLYRLKLMGC